MRGRMIGHCVLAAAAAATIVRLVPLPLLSQNNAPPKKPSFEVVSVKPSAPDGRSGLTSRGDRFVFSGATLRSLLVFAYSGNTRLLDDQIIGAPSWMDDDRFDIEGKADCSVGPVTAELLLQSMLEERFQFKARIETRELPIYNLVVAKDGPKIKRSDDQTAPTAASTGRPPLCAPPPVTTAAPRGAPPDPQAPLPRGFWRTLTSPAGRTVTSSATRISVQEANGPASLTYLLQLEMGRTVVDKTGLRGLFDVTLKYSPVSLAAETAPQPQTAPATATAPESFPSLTTALQEQLGLRLEAARGPVNVLVIVSVQKPIAN